jgi:hypothetical protein
MGDSGAIFPALLRQVFPRTRYREALLVQQAFDLEDRVNILAAIQPMSTRALDRLKGGELGFPVAQNKRLGRRQSANLADAEKRLFREIFHCVGRACHVFYVS